MFFIKVDVLSAINFDVSTVTCLDVPREAIDADLEEVVAVGHAELGAAVAAVAVAQLALSVLVAHELHRDLSVPATHLPAMQQYSYSCVLPLGVQKTFRMQLIFTCTVL